MATSDSRKFAFSVAVSIATAIWTVIVHSQSTSRDKDLSAEAAATEKRQENLEARLETFRTHGRQLDIIPTALGLLKENNCPSDFLALTLLRETRALVDDDDELSRGAIGLTATKAAFQLLSDRQEERSQSTGTAYCSCGLLNSINDDYVEQGQEDAETVKFIAGIVTAGKQHACKKPEDAAKLADASKVGEKRYSVVFINDTECSVVLGSYPKAVKAIAQLNLDPKKVSIARGHNRGVNYYVVAYGQGMLGLDEANEIIGRLKGVSGTRDDIYWARKLVFDTVGCAPPAP